MQHMTIFSDNVVIAYLPRNFARPTTIHPLWIQAAAEVVEKAMEIAKSKDFDRWKDDVSSKLDAILQSLNGIQQQLRDMQVWIDERIADEARAGYHRTIIALCQQVNQVVIAIGKQGNVPLSTQTDDIARDFHDLRIAVKEIMQTDGYSHAMAVVVGMTCLLPLFELAGRQIELKLYADDVITYLKAAVEPTNPHSIAAARNTHAARAITLTQTFLPRLNVSWLTNYSPGRSGGEINSQTLGIGEGGGGHNIPGVPPHGYAQTATGSVADGVTLAARQEIRFKGFPDWYPELQRDLSNPEASWAQMS